MISPFQIESNQTSEVQAKLKLILKETSKSTRAFGYTLFPMIFKATCNSLMKQLTDALDSGYKRIGIGAPRGFGKTSWTLYGLCARHLVFRLSRFLVYVTHTTTNAIIQTDNLKRSLLYNDLITKVFGSQHPENSLIEGNLTSIAKDGWSVANGSFILPRGAGQQVRGLQVLINNEIVRPELVVCDDLESSESVQSVDQRTKLRNWFYSDLLKVEDKYSDRMVIIYIDTLKHEDSLLNHIFQDKEWYSIRLEACDDNLKSNAPEYMSDAQIAAEYARHEKQGLLDIFYREYRNLPIASSNKSFKETNYRYFWETSNGSLATIPAVLNTTIKQEMANADIDFSKIKATQDNLFVIKKDFVGIGKYVRSFTVIIIDPAKTVNLKSADTAIVGITVTEMGLIFIRRIVAGKFSPEQIYTNVIVMCRDLQPNRVAVEISGLEAFITRPLKESLTAVGLGPLASMLIELNASGHKKEERIGWLSAYYERHQIYHNIQNYTILEQQLNTFPASKRIDVADAVSWLIKIISDIEMSFNTELINDYPSDEEDRLDYTFID